MTFNSIIAAYRRISEVKLAMDIFEEVPKLFGEPDEELYTAAIVTAVASVHKKLAVELSNEISKSGYFVPTLLIRIMCNVSNVERIGEEFRRVLSAMQALKIQPKRVALQSLISMYAKEADAA